jgi:signal transduction histidine kinase
VTSFLAEVLDYVAFDDADRARLRALHPTLAPRFPEIAARFYEAVWAHPATARILSGPEQVERLRVTLIDWMSSGLLGPHDERFYEKRSRIGRRHVVIGLGHQYMFTAMNVVRTGYHDLIAELYPAGEACSISRSVNKLLDIELAIMVRHYQLDSDEKLVARERRMQADRISSMQTMTAGLAHEVRNPLNAAKLQLELLDRRLHKHTDDPRLTEPTELAQKEIERLTDLLNDFLSFARPPELHLQDHDIVEIVRHVVDVERPTAEKHDATLTLVIAPDSLLARCDSGKLQQIVMNLVRNAIEAVRPGGHITVELAGTHDDFKIRVQDDGPGIPPDVQSRMFEPFFSTKEGGTGLGMSIVHSLVSLHGGAIEIDTGAHGTRFDVAIPRRQ